MSGRPWVAYLVVFVASACTLVLEIVAGRILAPFIGVSLYTWTSIIGVVLAGISLGNYVGGVVADRLGSRRTLGLILMVGGLASLAVLPLATAPLAALFPRSYPVVLRIVLITTLLFFTPSLVLGMVSPVVVKLTLADLARTGNIVGKIYAWSTLGSIVGTFLTGFVLIAHLGTRAIVFGVGLVLVLMGAVFGTPFRGDRRARTVDAVLVLLLVLALLQIRLHDAFDSGCYRETHYYCIKVSEKEAAGGRVVRVLALDHLIHGYNSVDDPTYIYYDYLKLHAEMAAYVAARTPDFRALFVGGGAYTLPRYLEVRYPRSVLEVAEIDPGVTRTNFELMGLDPRTRIVSHNADAREVVEAKQGGPRYHLVFGDAFNDLQIPYHLSTQEFTRRLRALMTDDGIYVALVMDKMRGGRFMAAYVATLRTVFPHVHVLAELAGTMAPVAQAFVVAASPSPIDFGRLRGMPGLGPNGQSVVRVLPQEAMEAWLAAAHPMVLTDDFAPADNLLAPIFLERGF